MEYLKQKYVTKPTDNKVSNKKLKDKLYPDRVLVTGFEPFGKDDKNASWEAVSLLPDMVEDVKIIKAQLPVVYDEVGDRLKELIHHYQPHAVFCVGQASGRTAITPEKVAINWKAAGIADNVGVTYDGAYINPDGDAAYFATIPVEKIVEELKKEQIPAQISYTAGTYVCNTTMYTLLAQLQQAAPEIMGGFIHVPNTYEQAVLRPQVPAMPLEVIVKGLEIAVRVIAFSGD